MAKPNKKKLIGTELAKDNYLKEYCYNYIQGLVRSRRYQEAYVIYETRRKEEKVNDSEGGGIFTVRSQAGRDLCKKYDLNYPINPEWKIEKSSHFIQYCKPASIVDFLDGPYLWRECDLRLDNQLIRKIRFNRENEFQKILNAKKITLINDRYFALMVNIEAPLEAIHDELQKFMRKHYKSHHRTKSTTLDIWKIHDLHYKQNLSEANIVRSLSPEFNSLQYTKKHKADFDNLRGKVNYALNKADGIIREIENKSRT